DRPGRVVGDAHAEGDGDEARLRCALDLVRRVGPVEAGVKGDDVVAVGSAGFYSFVRVAVHAAAQTGDALEGRFRRDDLLAVDLISGEVWRADGIPAHQDAAGRRSVEHKVRRGRGRCGVATGDDREDPRSVNRRFIRPVKIAVMPRVPTVNAPPCQVDEVADLVRQEIALIFVVVAGLDVKGHLFPAPAGVAGLRARRAEAGLGADAGRLSGCFCHAGNIALPVDVFGRRTRADRMDDRGRPLQVIPGRADVVLRDGRNLVAPVALQAGR